MIRKQEKQNKIFTKFGESITGQSDLLGDAAPSVLFPAIAALTSHLMTDDPSKALSENSMAVRRMLHPVLKRLVPLFLERKQVFESRNALLGIDAPDKPLKLPEEPVIWCPNHGFKDDVAASVLTARHAYILFGNLPMFFNTFDGLSAYINGVVMCNRKVKKSRTFSTEGAKRVLQMGTDLLLFPEGVWNKTPDKLVLDLWPGIYRIAKETGSKIIPVIHYLADPHKKYKGNIIHTVVADPVSMENLSEEEGLKLLRDTMATWYYLMMERYGHSSREELLDGFENADDAWESWLSMHTGLVKYYDKEIEQKADYRPKEIVRPEDVWIRLAETKNVHTGNATHVQYARKLVHQERKRDFQRRF